MEWRLDKFLTQIPVGTRSQVKDMIKKGRVCVNGVHASKPELKLLSIKRNAVVLWIYL